MAHKMEAYCKSLDRPEERREFKAHGHLDLVNFTGDLSIGRAVFEPGWKWSNDVKPIAGTRSCEAPHSGYCLSGSMVIRMDNGDEFTIQGGDAFQIPPGHDAWVQGAEPCVIVDVNGYRSYAKKSA